MTRVWLVRHGATTAPAGVAIGSTDPPLSALGLAQAQKLASRLALRPLTRVLSSDLERAMQTARPIAALHRIEVDAVPALREIDFGAWEGRSLAQLWSEDRPAARAWDADMRSTPATFAESFTDLDRRVCGWWNAVRAELDGEVAIVGHRGSLAVMLSSITGRPIEVAFDAAPEVGLAIDLIV